MDVEVADGIRRLSRGVVNFYLIEEGGRFTLVDAGTPRDWDLLDHALSRRGHALTDLEAVLLTHAHSDHTGFAERARTHARATVWVHSADRAVAKGAKPPRNEAGVGRYLLRVEGYRTLISLSRRGGAKIVPILEVSTFEDGRSLDLPGRPRIVYAPGHTAGTCAVASGDVVMTGDALITRNPLTGRRGPQVMPSALNVDTAQALSSLSAIEALSAATLLPGHGEPWSGGTEDAVRAARAAGRS